MQAFTPAEVASCQRISQQGTVHTVYRYGLLSITTPGARSFYVLTAFRQQGSQEELEISPVAGTQLREVRRLYETISRSAAPLSPLHLLDVVLDFRAASARPQSPRQPGKLVDVTGRL